MGLIGSVKVGLFRFTTGRIPQALRVRNRLAPPGSIPGRSTKLLDFYNL